MKFENKINKILRRNDRDTAQLYEHGDVHVMRRALSPNNADGMANSVDPDLGVV